MPTPIRPASPLLALLALSAAAGADLVPFNPQSIITSAANFADEVVLADIDRDGDLDAVVISEVDNTVAWYENTKNFAAPWDQHIIGTATSDPRGVAVGDVNGDGRPDVVVASFNDNSIRAFRSDTTPDAGTWAFDVVSTTSVGAQSVALADLDHDGDLDIIAASSSDDTVSWYQNSSSFPATWTEHIIDAALDGAVCVAAADMDEDGDIDITAAAFNQGQVVYYLNDGSPTSGWTRQLIANLPGATRVALGDLNQHSRPDVAAASSSAGMLLRCINMGNTVWAVSTLSSSLASPSGVSIADLDSNGRPDILASTSTDNSLHVFDNQNEGATFTHRLIAGAGMVRPTSIVAGDIDNDGDNDVLASSSGDDKVSLFVNRSIHRSAGLGGAEVSIAIDITGSGPLVADINGDLQPDVAARGSDGVLRWFRNNDTPFLPNWSAFTIASDGGNNSGPMTLLRAADLDNDGDLDIVRGCQGTFSTDYIDWLENDGDPLNGGWSRHVIDGGIGDNSSVVNDIRLADMDRDGDLDIVMSRWNSVASGSNGLYWYENQVAQFSLDNWNRRDIYTDSSSSSFQLFANGIGLGDPDRDGDTDVFCSIDDQSDSPRVLGIVWFRSDGAAMPAFTQMPTLPTPGFTTDSISVVDLDRDGRIDLVIGRNTWFHNISGSSLPNFVERDLGGSSADNFEIADLDLDGDLDLLDTDPNSNGVDRSFGWLENLGGNPITFTRHLVPTAGDARAAGLADFDQDGDLDAACIFDLSGGVGLRYLPNRAGHFALDASTTLTELFTNRAAPGPARSLLFTVDAAHLGRAGDVDQELSTLRVRWESNFGAPMTTPEFNAIIDNVLVYRDNGDGLFSPLTDTQFVNQAAATLNADGVASLLTPEAASEAVLPFVAPPARFFIAIRPTPNARAQPVNRFIATFITDSGADEATATGFCEDLLTDADLRIRADADTATGLVTFACPGDFNLSGSVTVQDIFDFLAAYFSADPRADFNDSAAITVQDLFDFLSAYFAPC
ncbi:MAG: VCBS repeat-containing protein [Phycisphaerales bacterium]|nr:VCBS repeat-containing protein [Phycisphaerales bacterium]